jgi:hypothetical protein
MIRAARRDEDLAVGSAAAEQERNGSRFAWEGRPILHLDVQVGFAGVPRVSAGGDDRPGLDAIARSNARAALPEVRHYEEARGPKIDNEVIPRDVRRVRLADWRVG